jgi:hypothetical protein
MLFEELVGMLRCFGGKVFWRSRKESERNSTARGGSPLD